MNRKIINLGNVRIKSKSKIKARESNGNGRNKNRIRLIITSKNFSRQCLHERKQKIKNKSKQHKDTMQKNRGQ